MESQKIDFYNFLDNFLSVIVKEYIFKDLYSAILVEFFQWKKFVKT